MKHNEPVTMLNEQQLIAEVASLEEQLTLQYPGVAAVMETYARAQECIEHVATFEAASTPRAVIITSNGSAC